MKKIVHTTDYGVFDNIKFQVEGNTVILTGKVYNLGVSSSAASRVKKVAGVENVVNNIETLAEKEDFWIRKGIGWTLREHAKTFPKEVKGFVKKHPGLSPLSKREALRNVR